MNEAVYAALVVVSTVLAVIEWYLFLLTRTLPALIPPGKPIAVGLAGELTRVVGAIAFGQTMIAIVATLVLVSPIDSLPLRVLLILVGQIGVLVILIAARKRFRAANPL